MNETLQFDDLLRLLDERSTVFRATIAAAPGLDPVWAWDPGGLRAWDPAT